MDKSFIIRFCLGILASAFVGMFLWALTLHNAKQDSIKYMPDIQAVDINGNRVDLNSCLDPAKRTAILYFHPECEFCRQEINGVLSRYSECRDVQWVFFTMAGIDELGEFLNEYPVQSIPGSFVVREDWPDLYEKLSLSSPPELFVYNENSVLMLHHKGAISIKTIVEELK